MRILHAQNCCTLQAQINDDKSLKYNKEVLKYAKKRGDLSGEGFVKHFIGTTYSELLEYEIAIEYEKSSYEINQKLDKKRWRNESLSSLLY